MKCPSCGEDNRDDALICGMCKLLFRRAAAPTAKSASENRPPDAPAGPKQFVLPRPPPPRASVPLLARGGIVLALLLGAFAFHRAVRLLRRTVADPPARPTVSAEVPVPRRLAEVAYEAPAPGRPLIERPGEDAFGCPRSMPDRLRLLSLLHHRRFAELTEHLEWFQAQFEADSRKELWPIDALETFDVIDPAVGPLLDAWTAASPDSFAPWAARATYRHRIAWTRRGGAFVKETPASRLQAMSLANGEALRDVTKALELRPGLVAGRRVAIWIAAMEGDDTGRTRAKLVEAGLALCPDCSALRTSYLYSLIPRWGGSPAKMAAFVAESRRRSKNPRLQLLEGYQHLDRCQVVRQEKRPQEALPHCDRAVAAGEHRDFLLDRAFTRARLDDHRGAIADLDLAIARLPHDPELLRDRAAGLAATRQWTRAAADLRLAQRLDPGDERTDKRLRALVSNLLYEAFQLERGGRLDDALPLYEQAVKLDPAHGDARLRRAAAETSRQLLQAVEREPLNVEAHVKLDHHWARQRRFEEVIAMWNRFLARRPDEPRAYLERGGALVHHGRRDLALADLDKACTSGLKDACQWRDELKRR